MRPLVRLLVCAAALLGSAATASAAAAADFISEGSSTLLTGTQEGVDVFTTTGGTVECEEVTYAGSLTSSPATTVKVTPTYSGCVAFGFASASINTNGCELEFHNEGTVDITSCESASGIIVTAALFGTQKCKVTVPPQSGINGIAYTNIGSGSTREITIDVKSTNIKYIEHGGTGFGACASSTEQSKGAYEGTTRLTGEEGGGQHRGIWFGAPPPPAEFHSESSGTLLTASQEGADVSTTTGGTIECGEIKYVGGSSETTASTFSMTPSFSECVAFGFFTGVYNTNGCEYVFHNSGTVDITSCNSASGVILTVTHFGTPKCKVTFVPQTGINGISYTNIGAGSTRELTIDMRSNNIRYVEHAGTGFNACTSSTEQTNGGYDGQTVVTGETALGKHLGVWFQ